MTSTTTDAFAVHVYDCGKLARLRLKTRTADFLGEMKCEHTTHELPEGYVWVTEHDRKRANNY